MDALRLLSRSTGLRPQAVKSQVQHIPSEGQPHLSKAQESEPNRKRKRDSDQLDAEDQSPLTEDEIRQVHKEHKIRIIDLRKSHIHDTSISRKAQKESAKLFPQPLTSFAKLSSLYGITKALSENVADQGYYEPTAVQVATIPLLLDNSNGGVDLLTVAPTGSGKTLAYLIPLIEKIRRSHRDSNEHASRHVSSIILAPTKELVAQIVNEGRKLTARTGVTITAMRKGMRLNEVESQWSSADSSEDEDEQPNSNRGLVKADILVSTPLPLIHAISGHPAEGPKEVDDHPGELPDISTLILDEADVLLDPLFRSQTLSVWESCLSPSLRTSFWSATIGSNIEELVLNSLADRQERFQIESWSPFIRTVIGLKDSSLPSISHKLVYAATEQGKLLGLRQLLHPSRSQPRPSPAESSNTATPLRPPFLIFTQTIQRATALHSELEYDIPAAAGGSSRLEVLHSSLSNTQRSNIMTRFRTGQIWILITTDLLSRGVDFRGVNGVVNYDIPTTVAGYVHRAGRTGRAGREGGVCVTFYTKEDVKYVKGIANVIAASQSKDDNDTHQKVEGLEKWVLDALPDLSKKDKKELKERGVMVRRGVKDSDNAKERKMKRKARIGTMSGYEKKLENNRRGAVMGSIRRAREGRIDEDDGEEDDNQEEGGWGGLGD